MHGWERADTEAVTCCICHREGRPIYDLDPFGVVRCPRCGLVFVSPRLRAEALERLYDDAGYYRDGVYGGKRRMSAALFLQRRWTAGRLALVQAESGRPAAGARLLEIGCAYGLFLDAARRRGYDVTGVELSKIAADRARERFGLAVHTGAVDAAPVAGRFDVVCAWDTVEHLADPVAFWRTVRELLTDDGVVLFSTPNFASLPSRLLRARWWTLKPAEHIWQFTPQTHRTVAARSGMHVTRTLHNPMLRANFGRIDSLVGVARPVGSVGQAS